MVCDLTSLISELRKYQPIGNIPKPKALNFIIDYHHFVKTLENINSMIGLKSAKIQVASQVKSFIVQNRLTGKPVNGDKLHTLILGPSGCGKTKLGKYLAELWAYSGCLGSKSPNTKLFAVRAEGSQRSTLDSTHNKHLLASREGQLKEIQLRDIQLKNSQNTILDLKRQVNEAIPLLNNVRKKVKAKNKDNELLIQSKFQELKRRIQNVGAAEIKHQLLPVIIPRANETISGFGTVNIPTNNSNNNNTNTNNKEIPAVKFVVVTKGDLVGKFQGHTTDQVRSFIEEHVGGVIMIDEAYDLCNSRSDDFGKEALTEIINFMSTWPDKVIFIFAGYRKQMEETLLKVQPGLARRFNWTFDIEKYSHLELCDIFQQQLSDTLWGLNPKDIDTLREFFKKNMDKFPHFGGDTERLCTFVKEACNEIHWKDALNDQITNAEFSNLFGTLTFDNINVAFERYLDNSVHELEKEANRKDFDKVKHIYT